MADLLKALIFVLAYIALMRWVLPWLGVPTWMARSCSVASRRQNTLEREPEPRPEQQRTF